LQAIVYHSAFDNEYFTLDNSSVLASSPSDVHQSVVPLEQNEGCSQWGLTLSSENRSRYNCESVSSEGIGSDDINTAITVEDLEAPFILQTNTRQSEIPPLKHFYFYQGKESFYFIIYRH
jgi:hypothetical protein